MGLLTDEGLSIINRSLLTSTLRARPESAIQVPYVADSRIRARADAGSSQLIFGRTGTGKTHLLIDLRREAADRGIPTALVSLRGIGATTDHYAGGSNAPVKATRLAIDLLAAVHSALRESIRAADALTDEITHALEAVLQATNQVQVLGPRLASGNPTPEEVDTSTSANPTILTDIGRTDVWLQLSTVREALTHLSQLTGGLVVLLDDWNAVPFAFQPFLADLIYRLLWDTPGCVVKIAATRTHAQFRTNHDHAGLIGFGIGDVAQIDLDDYFQIGNEGSAERRKWHTFVQDLLYAHVHSNWPDSEAIVTMPLDASSLGRTAFKAGALDVLVEASEGNPRDIVNIAMHAAGEAGTDPISRIDVEYAVARVLRENKITAATESPVMAWLTQKVISRSDSRCFVTAGRFGRVPPVLEPFYAARLVHRDRQGLTVEGSMDVWDEWHVDYGFARLMRAFVRRDIGAEGTPVKSFEGLNNAPILREGDEADTVDQEALEDFSATLNKMADLTIGARELIATLEEAGDYLVVDQGLRVDHHVLAASPTSIGRSTLSDIVLGLRTVSHKHATLYRVGSTWRIENHSKTNPLIVNGSKSHWHELQNGDILFLGEARVYFVRKD